MGKGKRQKRGGAKLSTGIVAGHTVKLFGRYFANIQTATGGSTQSGLVLHPSNLSNRFVEMMDMFEQWRWLKMSFTMYPNATGNTAGIGIVPTSNVTTQPTTFVAISQFDTFRVLGNGQTVPVKFRVPSSTLRGDTNWYDGSTNDYCCVAYFACATAATGALVTISSSITYMIEAEIEFKGASDPNVTLSRIKTRYFPDPDPDTSDDEVIELQSKRRSLTPKVSCAPRSKS